MNNNLIKSLLLYSTMFLGVSNTAFAEELTTEEQSNELTNVATNNSEDYMLVETTSSIIPKNTIMGKSEVSPDAFKSFFADMARNMNFTYKLDCTIDEFIDMVFEEALIENVRADIVIAQAIEETGYFQFGGIVKPSDNNFAGIGATGQAGVRAKFSSSRIGVRAQIQHLKAYASTDNLANFCVDPRFKYVNRGSAIYLEDLAGKWAVPGYDRSKYTSLDKALKANDSYGQKIYRTIEKVKSYNTTLDYIPPTSDNVANDDIAQLEDKVIGIVTARSLNVRTGAGTQYTVLTTIKKHTIINILSTDNGWYNVELSNGKKGWVSQEYIYTNSSSTISATTTARSLKVRTSAGTQNPVVTSIKKNTKVTVLDSTKKWYKVQLSNGKIGWVFNKYIKL